MSAMSSQKRKIAKLYKERVAIIRAAHKPEEYMKHRSHQKQIQRWLNEQEAFESSSQSVALERVGV